MEKQKFIMIISVYCLVVMIWSTTPLAIKWSGEDVGFLFGISARMLIGAILALLLVLMVYRKLCLHRHAVYAYVASGMAIYGAMLPVYWGAQYIPSGVVSVIFGLTPIITAVLAARFLFEQSLTLLKLMGALLGVIGLVIMFIKQWSLGEKALLGAMAVLLSVILHSMSSVWIKYLKPDVPALMITCGGLLFSLPLFALTYLVLGAELPVTIPLRALWSIIYLGVMGSVVGFVGYYFILVHLPASNVALITLITPVVALWIGSVFNFEVIDLSIWSGSGLVLSGLVMHQWGALILRSVWRVK